MPRIVRERPRRAIVATVAVVSVLAVGWFAGGSAAGSGAPPTPGTTTVVSTTTEIVVQPVTVPAKEPPRRAGATGRQRLGRKSEETPTK